MSGKLPPTSKKHLKTPKHFSKDELAAMFFGPVKIPPLAGTHRFSCDRWGFLGHNVGDDTTASMPTSFGLGHDPALTWTVYDRHVEFKDGLAAHILAKTSMAPAFIIPHERSSLMGASTRVVWKTMDHAALAFEQLSPMCPENPWVRYYGSLKSL